LSKLKSPDFVTRQRREDMVPDKETHTESELERNSNETASEDLILAEKRRQRQFHLVQIHQPLLELADAFQSPSQPLPALLATG
jgi:hypothetical protein